MNEDKIPQTRQLPNKPLVEAIFELRWKLQDPGTGLPPHDPGFRIALGRYYDQVRNEYPVTVDLPTSQVPEDMTAYTVRHQFRAAKDQWPVTQLGPGILTVNETAGYTWKTFHPRLLAAIDAILQAYPTSIAPLQPIGTQLRYIDAMPYNPQNQDPVSFLAKFLHTTVSVDSHLFENPAKPDAPTRLSLNMTFPLSKPSGSGSLGFATALRDNKPIILMETVIRSEADDVPKNKDGFATWLADAHAIAVDKWFFTLIRGKLLESFDPEHANANA